MTLSSSKLKRFGSTAEACGGLFDPCPIGVASAVVSGDGARFYIVAGEGLAGKEAAEDLGRFIKDLALHEGVRQGSLERVARHVSVRPVHVVEAPGAESDVDASRLGFVEAVERGEVRDAFRVCDGAAALEDVHDGGADLDAFCASEYLVGGLEHVAVEADFAFPVRDHGVAVALLDLA
jgi:hypothetical protein